ncbi:MAG: hypothetical protein LC808_02420 [Actinobacteria bacterium]|nr:hypothetical protein [Actinomycetota bacterium]
MSKRDPADAGDDVQPDVAVIASPSGGSQPGLVGGEPSLGQVDADGEAGAARRTVTKPVVGEAMGKCIGARDRGPQDASVGVRVR